MSRKTPEWIGKTDDTQPPKRVKLRVFKAHDGVCHLSGIKIRPGDDWQLDHVEALINGGRNCETNLAPALTQAHKEKTRDDVRLKAKSARVRSKHLGLHESRSPLPGGKKSKWKKKLDGTVVRRNDNE